LFNCVVWNPKEKFQWTFEKPIALNPASQSDRIYEAHVGMAGIEEKVNTYREFADFNIPMI
jgi:1,4-alpha-glucan branching enzyme